jgi:LPS O-antigen subunit length determinant protein (WzzB/FepE family)
MNDQTTPRQNELDDDEISLLDIFDFFVESWRSIVSLAILGGVVGAAVAFMITPKYQASAMIQPATVGSIESVTDVMKAVPVESPQILAEKMGSPAYYSNETISACDLTDRTDPSSALARALRPNVPRQSAFVAVAYEASSPQIARQCLEAVLEEVKQNQAQISRPMIEALNSRILFKEQDLSIQKTQRENFFKNQKIKLETAQSKLRDAEKLSLELEGQSGFQFSDNQFSASALLLATSQTTIAQIKDLKADIEQLQIVLTTGIGPNDAAIKRLENEIFVAKQSLTPPQTQTASFATNIYAPDQKTSPKRGLILVISVLAGGFLGLMLTIGRRTWSKIQSERQARAVR